MSASFNRDLTVNEIVSLIERQNSKDRAMLVQHLAKSKIIPDLHLSLVSFKFDMSAVILLNQPNLHLSIV